MTALTVGDVNLDVAGGRDDETELDRITREDIYRQRILSNTFKKVEGTFEVDTHKWKSWELVVYLGLVGLLTWYSLVRLDVKATYYVSEAVRSSIGDTSRMDWDPPVREQIAREGKVVALKNIATPEEVASWATFYLTQAILPSIQGFTMPFGAIRLTNRRVQLIDNPATRFDQIYPKVWAHDKGIKPRDSGDKWKDERENKQRFGAFRRKHLVGDDWKLEYMPRSPNSQCPGDGEIEGSRLLDQQEGVTAEECEELCGGRDSLNTIEVCRCATWKNPTDPTLGTCMIRSIPEAFLRPAGGQLPKSCSGKLCVVAPVLPAVNSTVLHPVMWQFEHKSRTPDANEPHAGYRDTPGFVEFLDLTNTAVVEQDQSTKRLKYIAKDQMLEIFGGGFVTRETASLALDFLAFHVNYQYYCWLQFTFQFLPEGGIAAKFEVEALPSKELQANMVPFAFWPDWILVICMGTWILIELRKLGRRIYKSIWLVVDLAWIGFGFYTIFLNRSLFQVDAATGDMKLFAATKTEGIDFSDSNALAVFFTNFEQTIGELQALLRFSSLFMLFTWLRIIKYLCDTSSHVGVLADTMKRASTAIVFFIFIILLMLFGFVSWGSVYFGNKVYAFKGFRQSLFTCLDWIFGNIDVLDEMQKKDELASGYFVTFMLIIYFVFVNFNNAILNAAYDSSEQAYMAKQEVRAQDAAGKVGFLSRILNLPPCRACARRFCKGRSPARAHTHHGLKDKVKSVAALEMHEEQAPEGESCKMIVLYCIFGIAYIALLQELCHIGPSYAMHATVTNTIENVAVEDQGRTLTINEVSGQGDALLWVQKALPKLLYSESTEYVSDTRYPQLVMRDWTIFYGQLPVRLMMRLYNTTTTEEAPDWLQDVGLQTRYPFLRAKPMAFLVNAGFHTHKVLPYRTDFNETDRIEDVQNPKQREALSKSYRDVEQIDNALLKEDRRLCLPASQHREDRTNMETDEIIDTYVTNHTCPLVGPRAILNSPCGYRQGFVCSIPADKEIGEPMLDYLGESSFISDQTASVVLDFVLFNANVGLFTYVAIEMSFPPSGTVEKSIFTSSMRLNPYDQGEGTWRMILFGLFVALWVFFIADEVISLGKEFLANKHVKSVPVRIVKTLVEHFTEDLYNVLDATSYAISAMTVTSWMAYLNEPIRMHFIFPEEPVWEELKCEQNWCADDDIIQKFYLLSIKFRTFVRIASVNCLIICIRVLKFFRGDEKMQVVIGTLANSLTRIMWFFVMLGLILMGFVTMSHIGFGTKILSFCSLENAVMASFQMVIGNYDYPALDSADEMLALVFFLPFMLIFFFVLMNIFLAIIDKSFREQEHAFQERQRHRRHKPKHGMIRRLRLALAAVAGGRHRAQSADEKKEAMSPVKKGHSHHMNGHHEKVEVGKPVEAKHHHSGVEASEFMEKCREAATSDRPGASRDVAASWLLMEDAKQQWSLETITKLHQDLIRWNAARHDMAGDELKGWLTDTLEKQLDERYEELQQQIAAAQERNKNEVMHELGESMGHQDVLCMQIQYLLDELSRTEGLRDENDQTYSRLREAASALIFGKQEGAEEDEG
jgi:hypothetical protein